MLDFIEGKVMCREIKAAGPESIGHSPSDKEIGTQAQKLESPLKARLRSGKARRSELGNLHQMPKLQRLSP